MIGPISFALALGVLSLLEYDFMRSLGWHPLNAPTLDWPSGLALGPLGGWMTAAWILAGVMTCLFACALYLTLDEIRSAKVGAAMLFCSGLALMGLAFQTDPTLRSTPATWHGQLHDLSYVLLGLSLAPAMMLLGAAFRQAATRSTFSGWQYLGEITWLTLALAIPAYILKGIAFYCFLFAILTWVEITAARLYQWGKLVGGKSI